MNKVVALLMKRDGMSEDDARQLVEDTRDELENCGGDYEKAIDIMADNLGLEMDYLIDLL